MKNVDILIDGTELGREYQFTIDPEPLLNKKLASQNTHLNNAISKKTSLMTLPDMYTIFAYSKKIQKNGAQSPEEEQCNKLIDTIRESLKKNIATGSGVYIGKSGTDILHDLESVALRDSNKNFKTRMPVYGYQQLSRVLNEKDGLEFMRNALMTSNNGIEIFENLKYGFGTDNIRLKTPKNVTDKYFPIFIGASRQEKSTGVNIILTDNTEKGYSFAVKYKK
ncbi:MAG: hypothetical protein ACP5NV_04840 [Candidatus Woesearchaeota archaeon]